MPALAQPLRLRLLLLALASQVAAPCSEPFIDGDGDEWDLDSLAGIRTASGPGTVGGTWTYKFDICANISPNPSTCELAGLFGTVAARYTLTAPSTCEQLGPDFNVDPDDVIVAKVTVGAADGVSLKWSSIESGARSFELKIICGTLSTVGTATGTTTAPIVQWTNPGVCDGPIESPSPAPGGGGDSEGLEWGALTLILLSVSGVLYVGGGTYNNTRQNGLSGKEALPNRDFWFSLPGYFADGVYFSRTKVGGAHPSLGFLTPSGDGPSGGGSYEAVDEEAGGKKSSEKSGLISAGDGTDADPPALLPGGSKSGSKKSKASGKAGAAAAARAKAKQAKASKAKKAKPKPKQEKDSSKAGRKPAGSALE